MKQIRRTVFVEPRKGFDIPGLRFGDSLGTPERKISLGLRTDSFDSELLTRRYPKDKKKMVSYLMQIREQQFELKYELVFWFNRMSDHGPMGDWLPSFGFKSLEDFLAQLGLQEGTTLATWEILVRLFDRDTFVLVGDKLLQDMTRMVSKFEDNIDQRKVSYEIIFKEYCKKYTVFNAKKFVEIVHWYVNTNYINMPKDKGSNYTQDPYKKPQTTSEVGTHDLKSVVGVTQQQTMNPILTNDFVVTQRQCSGCAKREEIIKAWEFYYATVMKEKLRCNCPEALKFLPALPKILMK